MIAKKKTHFWIESREKYRAGLRNQHAITIPQFGSVKALGRPEMQRRLRPAVPRAVTDNGARVTAQVSHTLPGTLYPQPEYSKVPSILFQFLPNKKKRVKKVKWQSQERKYTKGISTTVVKSEWKQLGSFFTYRNSSVWFSLFTYFMQAGVTVR